MERVVAIAQMTDMLQTASLLIDDIEDNSEIRRGIPAAHVVFGIPNTINTANYVYFLCLQQALSLNHPSVATVFTGKHQLLAKPDLNSVSGSLEPTRLHGGSGQHFRWRQWSLIFSKLRKVIKINGLSIRRNSAEFTRSDVKVKSLGIPRYAEVILTR